MRFNLGDGANTYSRAFSFEPESSPADGLRYRADVISWCGSSEEWGVWAERRFGIGVFATRRTDVSWPVFKSVPFCDLQSALKNLASLNFSGGVVPESFSSQMKKNYGVVYPSIE